MRGELQLRTAPRDRHYLWVTLAQLASYRGRTLEAWSALAEAEKHLDGLWAEERLPFYAARGTCALELGQIDLAAIDFAVRSSMSRDVLARYHETLLAFAAEDHDRAERSARELIAEQPPDIDPGDLEALAAAAHLLQDPASPSNCAEASLGIERALAATKQPMVRCHCHLFQAHIALFKGDVDAADAAVAQAETVRASSRSGDSDSIIAVLHARIDLERLRPADVLAAHRERLAAVLRQDVDTWLALSPRPGGVGFLQFAVRRDALATAIAVEQRLRPDEPAAGFELLLQFDAVHTLARRLDAGAATLADVQAIAPDDGAVLCALPALHASWAFLVTRTAIEAHELPGLAGVAPLARRMRAVLADLDPTTREHRCARLAADGRAAADLLLPPALRARVLASHQLVFVGASLLDGLPLEALPGPGGGWLGAERAISYLPSFAVGVTLARRFAAMPQARADLALFAATRPAMTDTGTTAFDLGSVPDAWCRLVQRSVAVVGAEATRDAFTRLPEASLLCVIAHGTAAPALPGDDRTAALAIAGAPASLRCADVEAAGRAARCVFLAACGGARGPVRRGDDGSNHLAGALLFGGACAVIAAEPDLDLGPTLATATRVLDGLADSQSAAEALRAARAAALARPDADVSQVLALRLHGIGHLANPVVAAQPGGASRAVAWSAGALLAVAALLLWARCRRAPGERPS